MRRKFSWGLIAAAGVLLSLTSLSGVKKVNAAVTAVYGNNADGIPYVLVMTPGTLGVTRTISNLSGSNGRGVVVVNGTMYYTSAGTNNVFSYNLSTSTDNGSLFTVPGTSALSTIAFDGTNLWIGDYGGSGKAYLYSLTGTLLRTVTLANCGSNCDGLEYFLQNGTTPRLISNRGDAIGPYDIYDTNGTLITASFINPSFSSTGIAYDGSNFYVSDIFNAKLAYYNGSTGALISSTAITGANPSFAPVIEDLSVDYTQVLNTPTPTAAPALSPSLLIVCSLLLLGLGLTLLQKRASA